MSPSYSTLPGNSLPPLPFTTLALRSLLGFLLGFLHQWEQKESLRRLDDTSRVIVVQFVQFLFEIIHKAFSLFRKIVLERFLEDIRLL